MSRAFKKSADSLAGSQFFRFCCVGLLNTAVNYAVFLSLLELSFMRFYIAGAAGFLSGAVIGFYLNREYAFKSHVNRQRGIRAYLLIQMICLLVHFCVQVSLVAFAAVAIGWSQLFGIATTTVLNYNLVKTYVFAERR